MARIAAGLAALVCVLLAPANAFGATLSGAVRSSSPFVGISGACVQAATGAPGGALATAVTASDGSYTLTGLQAGTRTIHAFPCGLPYKRQSSAGSSVTLTADENRTGFGLELDPISRSIAGTATDQNGAPVSGLTVRSTTAASTTPVETVTTAFNGKYTVPVGSNGDYKLRFNETNGAYAEEWWQDKPGHATANPITVGTGQHVTAINPQVTYNRAEIKGTVTGANGSPLQNVLVAAVPSPSGSTADTDYTDATGAYDLQVTAGAYTVSFSPQHGTATPPTSDHLREYWDDKASSGTANVITVAGGSSFTANAQLAKGSSVAGRLVDEQGDPISGFEVKLYQEDDTEEPNSPFQSAETVTDANGDFVVRGVLIASTLNRMYVSAQPPFGGGPDPYLVGGRSSEFTLGPGQDVTGKNIVAERWGKVAGEVARAGGANLDGLFEVMVLTPAGIVTSRQTSFGDPRGFEVLLKPGSYRIRAQDHELDNFGLGYHSSATTLAGSTAVTVTAGATTTLPDIELPAITAAPPNDDVADAEDLGAGAVVSAAAPNLGATKESGEPNVAGHANSTWWRWTAPADGTYVVDECGPLSSDVRVYTGTSVATLVPVPGQASDGACGGENRRFAATAGTAYLIGLTSDRVDDARISIAPFAAGVPGSNVQLVDPTRPLSSPAVDAHRRSGVATGAARFAFSAINRTTGGTYTDGTRTYECALDGAAFASCPAVHDVSGLATGSHVLRIRATRNGLTDPTPDELRFWVVEPRPECAGGGDADGDGANGWPQDTGCISDQDGDERDVGIPAVTPPDGDGDGVPDDTDDCPAQAGPPSNQGCPVASGPDPGTPGGGGGGVGGGGSTPPPGGGGGGGTTPPAVVLPPVRSAADRTVDRPKLAVAASQRQRRGIAVALSAGAGEAVTVTTTATVRVGRKRYALKPLSRAVAAGKTAALKLTLRRSKDAARIRTALRRKTKVTVALTVTFTDRAGNRATQTKTIRLR